MHFESVSNTARKESGSAFKLVALTALLLSSASTAAFAQASNSGELETVVVTARYTQENLQATPVAITSVSADQLQTANVVSVSSLGAVVPNLFTHPGDADEGGTPVIILRGVSETDASYAREPAVGLFVDDVYHATMIGVDMDMTDIDHVEVKRGPQGTLGGNASIGGTISIFSKQPKGDNTGHISFTYGSYNKQQLDASYDFAFSDNFFGRVSASQERQDGFFKTLDFTCMMKALGTPQLAGTFPENPSTAQHGCVLDYAGGTNHASTKLQLRYVASSRLEMNFQMSYFKTDDETAPEKNLYIVNSYVAPAGASYPSYVNNSLSPAQFGQSPSALVIVMNQWLQNTYGVQFDNRLLSPPGLKYSSYASFCRPAYNGPTVQQPGFPPVNFGFCYPNKQGMDSVDISYKIDYDISDKVHSKTIFAADSYHDLVFQNGGYDPFGYDLFRVDQPVKQASVEERLSGTAFGDKLTWVGGVFGLSSKGISRGFVGYLADNFTEDDTAYKQTAAVYLHGEYQVTDALSVSAGGRFTYNKLKYYFNHPELEVFNGVPYTVPPFSVHAYHWDWNVSANYQITDDLMAYGSISTGYRPPGLTTIVNTAAQLSGYPGEELTSYEIGFKTEWFDHRLRINPTAFYSDYSKRLVGQGGYQCLGQPGVATWFASNTSCNQFANTTSVSWSITSARPATVKGVELETTAEPVDGLLLSYSGGYNTFSSSVTTPGQPGYLHPGVTLQPVWNMSASIQYTMDGMGGAWTPNLSWNWQSDQKINAISTAAPDIYHSTPAQSVFNAGLAYQPDDSKWKFDLTIANLTNLYYYYQPFTGNPDEIASNLAPPREWFFKVTRSF